MSCNNNTLHYKDYLSLGITASGTWNGICAQPEYVRLFDEEDARLDGTFLTGLDDRTNQQASRL